MPEQITRVQFDPGVEAVHRRILARIEPLAFDTTSLTNPFAVFTPWDLDQLYMDPEDRDENIGKFPRLFDLYNDHILSLDLMNVYSQSIARSIAAIDPSTGGRIIDQQVAVRRDWLLDEFDTKIRPRLSAGFRDLNSVMSSQFTTARAIALRDHTRQLNDFAAQLTIRFADYGANVWAQTLAWHEKVPAVYSQALSVYTAQRIDVEKHVFELSAKCCLWPYTVFAHVTSLLAALSGSSTTQTAVAGESPGSTGGGRLAGVAGGALSGAISGSAAGPWGAGIGAVVGAIGGLFG